MKRLFFLTLTYLFIVTGCGSPNATIDNTTIAVPNTTLVTTTTITEAVTTVTDVNTTPMLTNTAITTVTDTNLTKTTLETTLNENTALNEQPTNTGDVPNTNVTSKVNMDKYVISSSKVSSIKAGMTSEELTKEIGMEAYNPTNTAIGKEKVTVSYYDSDYNPVNITFVNGVVESISK